MRVLLLQLDGKIPNLALMRLAGHHRGLGDTVVLRHVRNAEVARRDLFPESWDRIYASAIFERTKPVCKAVHERYPDAIIGGSGWDESITVEQHGVAPDQRPDYSDYQSFTASIGFTQRGCRLQCSFCKVPRMEGKNRPAATIRDIYRGEPFPRHLLLLDNDFFGQPAWRELLKEIRDGGFKVCFNQGFNVRLINDEQAEAIASVNYYDDQFKTRRLYCAWDNRRDEDRLFRNLDALKTHGVQPDNILVYMLVGYWRGSVLTDDDFYRHRKLREFGCRPYPMPYERTRELVGFQRWIVGAYDKRIPWSRWVAAGYEPRRLDYGGKSLFDGSEGNSDA